MEAGEGETVDLADALELSNLGMEQVRNGELDLAISTFSKAISIAPNYAIAFLSRAGAYAAKGDNDNALADFNATIVRKADPSLGVANLAIAYNGRGVIFLRKEEYDKALADFDAAIATDRTYSDFYRNKAEALLKKSQFVDALDEVNRALWIRPKYANGYATRARIYAALGRIGDAAADNAHSAALSALSAHPIADAFRTVTSRIYTSPAVACIEDDKYSIQIGITRGTVTVQPLLVGVGHTISIRHDREDLVLRLGKQGCRIDIAIGKNVIRGGVATRVMTDELELDSFSTKEIPPYIQTFYEEPSSGCADTGLFVRAYWGLIELRENHRLPDRRVRSFGSVQQYGDQGCQIGVLISKVD
jgi:tetratricopeptide (TPR) repeat protein